MQNLAQDVINTVCPVCSMPVDEHLQPVIAMVCADEAGDHIHRMGACGHEHAQMMARDPLLYVEAALNNQPAQTFEDA